MTLQKSGGMENASKVICTPHLGASTTEAQEGVAVEIVEAVAAALKGRAILSDRLKRFSR